MEEENARPKYVSRVYTRSGICRIGDTKVSGDTYLTVKSLEAMINNSEIEAVVSPPRPKTQPLPPKEVIKYPLDSKVTPMEIYERSYFPQKKDECLIQDASTDNSLKRSSADKYLDLPETSAKKSRSTSNLPRISSSPTSSTASTVVLDVADDEQGVYLPGTSTSSTNETITFASPQLYQVDESNNNPTTNATSEPSNLILALDLRTLQNTKPQVLY